MTDAGFPDIGEMIKQISANPTARDMLAGMLGSSEESPENQGSAPLGAESVATGATPFSHRPHGGGRRALLRALRPYLGTRRAASLDRMQRALDIYELIEQMLHTKGGN